MLGAVELTQTDRAYGSVSLFSPPRQDGLLEIRLSSQLLYYLKMHTLVKIEGSWIGSLLETTHQRSQWRSGDGLFMINRTMNLAGVDIDPKVLCVLLFGFLWIVHHLYVYWKLRVSRSHS